MNISKFSRINIRKALFLFSLIMMVSFGFVNVYAQTTVGDYEVELLDVTWDPVAGEQKWTYNVSYPVGVSQGGISHIVFNFQQICDPPLGVITGAGFILDGVEYIYPGTNQIVNGTGIEPLGLDGIKYELPDSVEAPGYVIIWFKLSGQWERHDPPGQGIMIYIKHGGGPTENKNGWVPGPNCIKLVIPEFPLGTIAAVSSSLAALILYRKRR